MRQAVSVASLIVVVGGVWFLLSIAADTPTADWLFGLGLVLIGVAGLVYARRTAERYAAMQEQMETTEAFRRALYK